MILPLVVLLFAMVGPLSSIETPFQLANCTAYPLSATYELKSPNSTKLCVPISTPWKVNFSSEGVPLFNASMSNVLCVFDPSTVYFNGSVGFSGKRASLTVCRVTDGNCVQVNLVGYGIYALNTTFIAAGANLNQPLWETFGITNPSFTVCDNTLKTLVNVTTFDDPKTVDCLYSDSFPARNIQLQSPLLLPAGTYIIILSSGSCDGPGVKSEPLTLIVTSSVAPVTSTTSVAIATTYVAMITSATPSVSNVPSSNSAEDALSIGIGAGAGGVVVCVIVIIIIVLLIVLVTRNTQKIVQGGEQARVAFSDLKEPETDGQTHSKPSSSTTDLAAHILQTDNEHVQHSQNEVKTSMKRVVLIAEEDNQWHKELAKKLAEHHHCEPQFLAWTSSSRDFSRSVYQLLTREDCAQVYVVWKGPLEDKQSSGFHSFVCELETKPAVQKLGLVQLGVSTTATFVKHCEHTRIVLITSDSADITPEIQIKLDHIHKEQKEQRSILEKIVATSSGTLETVQNVDTKILDLTIESRQTVDAVQTLVLTGIDPHPI